MSHYSAPSGYTAAVTDSSWGTAPSSGHAPSSTLTWGSEGSKSPLSSHHASAGPPAPSISPASPSWGSQASTLQGSWPYIAPSTASSYHSAAVSLSSASSITVVDGPLGVRALPQSGYPADLSGCPPTAICLHPDLQDARRLRIDMAGPPPTMSGNPTLGQSAFTPSVTYMEIHFDGFPHWTLRVHSAKGLSVFSVLEHIYHHLQGKNTIPIGYQNMQRPSYGRDPSSTSASFNAGCRRVDVFGPKTKFIGLRPSSGANGWMACFTS